jgi:outer membrane biosynthesis protein TonB
MSEQEKKNQRTGMMVSIGIHTALIILFFFILAWRAPNPPLPEYGIEINFGLDKAGSTENPRPTPANTSKSTEDSKPEPKAAKEVVEEKVVEQKPAETQPPVPVKEVVEAKEIESPDVVEDKKIEKPVKEVAKPVKEPVKEAPKPVNEPVKPTPTPTAETKSAVKESKTAGADGKAGTSTEAAASNQGDNKDKVGDKGDPKGSLDARALYGTPGGGSGGSLSMSGWTWDFEPDPKEQSNETGLLVFEVKIDDQGEILSIRRLQGTVSPAVERVYRAEVEKLTFSKLSGNTSVAPTSTGTITFRISSK